PRVGASARGDVQRLAGARRLVGDDKESRGVADAYEIAHENVRAAGIEHPVDIVMRLDDGLVAGADLVGEAQLAVAAARQKRERQSAALTGDGDRLGPAAL